MDADPSSYRPAVAARTEIKFFHEVRWVPFSEVDCTKCQKSIALKRPLLLAAIGLDGSVTASIGYESSATSLQGLQ
jgi:hypothetical protein